MNRVIGMPTDIERLLGTALRVNRISFQSEVQVGPYRVDFMIPKSKIVIEADGAHWHRGARLLKDKARDKYLTACGYQVVRFKGSAIKKSAADCVQAVLAMIE